MASPRTWLITGTSSGFGRRLVSIVLARGDRVIATAKSLASISSAYFLQDSEIAEEHRSRVYCAELDIAVGMQQVKKQIDSMVERSGWGGVDVLVNNAGVALSAFLEEGGADLMRKQYQTNVFGTLDVTLAVLPYMRKQRSGTIVMMGSRSGWKTELQGVAFYASSKAALHAISETLAIEIAPFGIRTLIVEPGAFRTEGIYRIAFGAPNPIGDYDDKRGGVASAFGAPAGKQRGDPVKAMQVLVDVVRDEGPAQGRGWPLYLVLGNDADQDVRDKCVRMVRHLDKWGDVARDLDLDSNLVHGSSPKL